MEIKTRRILLEISSDPKYDKCNKKFPKNYISRMFLERCQILLRVYFQSYRQILLIKYSFKVSKSISNVSQSLFQKNNKNVLISTSHS